MVVPYLRNPRRNRNSPVAIKTKSQYHLEPDHTSTYEPSTYQHVGRRTKGGSGGGYLYKSSSSSYNSKSSKYSGGGGEAGVITAYVFFGFFGLFGLVLASWILICIFKWFVDLCADLCFEVSECFRGQKVRLQRYKQNRQHRREVVRQLEQLSRQQQETQESDANIWHLHLSERHHGQSGDPESPNLGDEVSAEPNAPHITAIQEYASRYHPNANGDSSIEVILTRMNRQRLIRSKLHYQVVLPDKSNVTAQSIRNNTNTDSKVDEATQASEDDSIIAADETKKLSGKKKQPAAKKNVSSSSSTFYFTLRNLLSFRPIKQEDCSICLECFAPCQTICVAKNSCCNHVFHEECIESWLMEHDHCPNCRSNMMDDTLWC